MEKDIGLKFIEEKIITIGDKKMDEKDLFCHYYAVALEQVCQLGVLIDWFKSLCHLVHENEQPHINVLTPINTILEIRYQPTKKRRTRTFSYGDTMENEPKTVQVEERKEEELSEQQKENRLSNWVTSLRPIVTGKP